MPLCFSVVNLREIGGRKEARAGKNFSKRAAAFGAILTTVASRGCPQWCWGWVIAPRHYPQIPCWAKISKCGAHLASSSSAQISVLTYITAHRDALKMITRTISACRLLAVWLMFSVLMIMIKIIRVNCNLISVLIYRSFYSFDF